MECGGELVRAGLNCLGHRRQQTPLAGGRITQTLSDRRRCINRRPDTLLAFDGVLFNRHIAEATSPTRETAALERFQKSKRS
jgi:hypothetical protein